MTSINSAEKGPFMRSPKELRKRLKKIRLVSMDVDGVMTDGGIYLGEGGAEFKRFDVRDGAGVVYLHRQGILPVVITGRRSDAVEARCRELGIVECHQRVKKKWAVLRSLLDKYDIMPEEAAHIGDDLLDLALVGNVGLFLAPADASAEVRKRADYVAKAGGGRGAVRELAELILKAQGKWKAVVQDNLKLADLDT
ncbi:MAG: hypothetical protein Kow0059_14190 [Candidatus Sumerlaeia bacterium]